MKLFLLNGVISEDHKLIVDLPDDIPNGPVKVTILYDKTPNAGETEPTIEEIRAKLVAIGELAIDGELDDRRSWKKS